jgi:predicted kinase
MGEATGAQVLRSDVVRKELAGLPADAPAGAPFEKGIYNAENTTSVYDELLRRAEHALRRGEIVVLDASWDAEAHRAAARALAAETASALVELRCVAPPDVAVARITARAAAGGDASDADAGIANAIAATSDPWPTSTALDTAVEPAAVVAAALAHVGPW